VHDTHSQVTHASFVLFTPDVLAAFEQALAALG
jgi:hypothetical protein